MFSILTTDGQKCAKKRQIILTGRFTSLSFYLIAELWSTSSEDGDFEARYGKPGLLKIPSVNTSVSDFGILYFLKRIVCYNI